MGPKKNQNYTKSQFCNWVKNNSRYFITDKGDVENYFKLLPFNLNNIKAAYSK